MTSLPEQTPKKMTVPPIVALPSSGCKQAFPLLTVDLQRARHTIFMVSGENEMVLFLINKVTLLKVSSHLNAVRNVLESAKFTLLLLILVN
jgi:hypothetical protein